MAVYAMQNMQTALQYYLQGQYLHSRPLFEDSLRRFDDHIFTLMPALPANKWATSAARKAIKLLVSCFMLKPQHTRHLIILEQMMDFLTLTASNFINAEQRRQLDGLADNVKELAATLLDRDLRHPWLYACVS